MTVIEFCGCSLIGFGPPILLFVLTVGNDPILIIVCVASAFFWILSLLISAGWWMIIFPLKEYPAFGLVFSVLFQELFRYFLYLLLSGADKGLKQVWIMESHDSIMSSNKLSYVAGIGFGTVSCTFSLVNLMASMYSPGTIGLLGNDPDFFITSSLLAHGFFLMHTFGNVIFFNGFQRKAYYQPIIVVASHMIVSCTTLTNMYFGATASIVIAYCTILLMITWCYTLIGGTRRHLRESVFSNKSQNKEKK